MKTQLCLYIFALLLLSPAARSAQNSVLSAKSSEPLETCLIKNSHRHLKGGGVTAGALDGKDRIYSAEEEAWKDCRQGRGDDDDPWQASEVQIMRAKVRMQLTWEQMNEHGA